MTGLTLPAGPDHEALAAIDVEWPHPASLAELDAETALHEPTLCSRRAPNPAKESIVNYPIVAVLVAQETGVSGIGAKFAGLGTQAVAALALIAVAWGTALLMWSLLKAMLTEPKVDKLVGLVIAMLVAVALVGAAPSLIDMAYEFGTDFIAS